MIFPLYGLAFAQTFSEMTLGIIAVFMLRKIFRDCSAEEQAMKMAAQ